MVACHRPGPWLPPPSALPPPSLRPSLLLPSFPYFFLPLSLLAAYQSFSPHPLLLFLLFSSIFSFPLFLLPLPFWGGVLMV